MTPDICLKVGDCVYYEPNRAFGVLLERLVLDSGKVMWRHALRSPPRSDLEDIKVSVQTSPESSFVGAISKGRLNYYPTIAI